MRKEKEMAQAPFYLMPTAFLTNFYYICRMEIIAEQNASSPDSNQNTTIKMGVELKPNSPNVTTAIQFGIKLDDQ